MVSHIVISISFKLLSKDNKFGHCSEWKTLLLIGTNDIDVVYNFLTFRMGVRAFVMRFGNFTSNECTIYSLTKPWTITSKWKKWLSITSRWELSLNAAVARNVHQTVHQYSNTNIRIHDGNLWPFANFDLNQINRGYIQYCDNTHCTMHIKVAFGRLLWTYNSIITHGHSFRSFSICIEIHAFGDK